MSAFLYFLLDYYFLGLTYIIVYVGAIAILFLFVIMMCETKETPKLGNINTTVVSYASYSPVVNQKKDDKMKMILISSFM